eukprot:Nk52_evm3s2133 gene=Nk52_evmTU3s2133
MHNYYLSEQVVSFIAAEKRTSADSTADDFNVSGSPESSLAARRSEEVQRNSSAMIYIRPRRRNGLELPLNFFQLFVMGYVVSMLLLFYLTAWYATDVFEYLWKNVTKDCVGRGDTESDCDNWGFSPVSTTDMVLVSLVAFHTVFASIAVIAWFVCSICDVAHPLLIKREQRVRTGMSERSPLMAGIDGAETGEGDYFCNICNIAVGRQTKHCHVCERCTDHFDHHCVFMNTCISGSNYRYFFTTVLCLFASAFIEVFMGLMIEMNGPSDLGNTFAVALLCVSCGGMVAFGCLLMMHIVLCCMGVSTYEFLMRKRRKLCNEENVHTGEDLSR